MDLSGSWKYAQIISRSRLANNKTVHHVSEFGDGIELLGAVGEIVARRYLGLPEKLHCGFDHGIDIFVYGMKIDVKTTVLTPKVEHRYLQWPTWKPVKADIILLTAVDPVTKIGTVLGYATRLEVQTAPINNNRFVACHEIPIRDLHPAWELIAEGLQICRHTQNREEL